MKTLYYMHMKLFGCLDTEIENQPIHVWLRFTDFSFGQFVYAWIDGKRWNATTLFVIVWIV